jgi:multidrug efflux pump subunit AcrA (membrane-fusion protein)
MQSGKFTKISIKPPASLSYGIAIACVFLSALALYFLNLDYPARFDAVGWIESYDRHVKVFTSSEGVVSEIYTTEGGIVAVGDKLLKITQSEEDDFINESLIKTTQYEIRQLLEQIAVETQKNAYEIDSLALLIDRAKVELKNNEVRKKAYLEKYELTQHKLEGALKLNKNGYISDKDVDSIQLEKINAEIDLNELQAQNDLLHSEIKSDELQAATKQVELQRTLSQLNIALTNKQAELAKLEANHGAVIRAPSAGVVDYIHTFAGQRLSAASPLSERLLLAIAPLDNRIKIKLLIPAELVEKVKPDAIVDMIIKSTVYKEEYPLKGRINAISKTAFDPKEISTFPVADPRPVVVATITPMVENGENPFKDSISLTQGVEIASSITTEHTKVYARLIAALFSGKK